MILEGEAGRGKRNFSFLISEKFLQLGSIAVVNIFILRALGPESYGTLSAATAILAIVLPLAAFGMLPIVREISFMRSSARRAVSLGILMSGVMSVLCLVILLVLGRTAFSGSVTGDVLIILAFLFVAKPFAAVDAWFQANRLNHVSSKIRIVFLVLASMARLAVAFYFPSVEALAVVIVAENSAIALALFVKYRLMLGETPETSKAEPVDVSGILAASWPLLLSGLAIILYMRSDQPLLLWLSGPHSVGLYSAAANLADSISFIPVTIATILLPGLVVLHSTNPRRFIRRVRGVLDLGAGLGYVTALGGIFLGPLVVQILYGSAYDSSGRLVQILFCSAPFVFMGVLQGSFMIANGFQKITLVISILSATVNISANLLVLPLFGAVGAAATTVVSHAIGGMLGNVFFPETRVLFRAQCHALNPLNSLPALWRFARDRRVY